ncbi:MAG: DpnII family type II restriction endonuclease, partial [Clostridium baratii]|nr:DpnII family type II restriction endonuclease [Clostridium baratii]
MNKEVKPFLKWAGGKSQLLSEINNNLPNNIENNKTYVEAFVGAGAVFFDFISKDIFDKYIINDINEKLINLYKVIRDNPDLFIRKLNEKKQEYLNSSEEEREKMFYEIREEFNKEKEDLIIQAVEFLFLNKTAFNGLYRENSKGDFNVPWGRYKNPSFYDEETIRDISKVLNKKNKNGDLVVDIRSGEFFELENIIDKNTFVYLDPPYRPVTVGGFNSYNKSSFNDDKQIELRDFYKRMSDKGAKLMLSNSDPKNLDENDEFFDELYKDFNIKRVYARRNINSKGSERGKITEILVTNYNVDNIIDENVVDTYKDSKKGRGKMKNYVKSDESFEYLISTLKDTIKSFDYFVNWEKVIKNVTSLEVSLNILNTLIGKENIEEVFKEILTEYPKTFSVVPILLASRDKKISILKPQIDDEIRFDIDMYDFSIKKSLTEEEINYAVEFTKKTGILDLLKNKKIKNLVDYVMGVEVGLDSNGRKNRSGTSMEGLVELFIKRICKDKNFEYMDQATPEKIMKKWGKEVETDKASRRFDFAIN